MKTFKESKILSLFIVLLIYIIAFYLGIIVFNYFDNFSVVIRILLCEITATIIVYAFGVLLNNSSVYDPYWSVAPAILILILINFYKNYSLLAMLCVIVVFLWSVRLTSNWIYTFSNLNWQDWRYLKYKKQNPKLWQFINFFGINLMPTLIVFCAFSPMIFVLKSNYNVNLFTFLALLLSIFSPILQLIADITMHKFRKNCKDSVCCKGVWKYSRHPNYLGEILFWWSIYFIAISVNLSYWWMFFGAFFNNMLFVFISIPIMEKRQLSKRPQYEDYIKTTNKLFFLSIKNREKQTGINE
jgi:steroid 5-alpha reductase family enzyme